MNQAAPFFELAEGGLLLAFVRSLSVMALFSAFGALVFRVFVAPRAFARMAPEQVSTVDRRLCRLIRASLLLDIAALAAWLVLEAGILDEAPSFAAALAAVSPVASKTAFGHVILMQLAAALATAVVLGRGAGEFRCRLAAGIAALAVLLQAGHSHALAMERGVSLLLASDAVHQLSAGAWLGGLVPLLMLVAAAPPQAGAIAARYFSPLGKLCLYGLVATAAYQGWQLLGGVPGLVGTAYGWMALVKAALFAVLFGFAWVNRYRLAPALRHGDGTAAKRAVVRSIAMQTGFGIAVVIAAGLLSSLPPGLRTQPIWPFRLQPSLVTIEEDAGFRREVVAAVLALGFAALLLALGIALRRLRWPALALGVLVAGFAAPHLDLLFVEAYPTSFYRSPTGFTATAIADGAALFPAHCAGCHGAEGRGDGPDAKSLPIPPADLAAGHLWGHDDGELFWWLSHGIDAPAGGLAMPGFAASLSDDQRWDLIDYIRAHNAGLVHAVAGGWSPPIHAPDLTAACAGMGRTTLAALRGKVVRIVFGGPDAAPAILPQDGIEVVTIIVPSDVASAPAAGAGCIASDPAIRASYAVVSGIPPDQLSGLQFLVDPNGWLRAVRPAEPDGGLARGSAPLLAEIEQICRHPIENQGGMSAHHHHP